MLMIRFFQHENSRKLHFHTNAFQPSPDQNFPLKKLCRLGTVSNISFSANITQTLLQIKKINIRPPLVSYKLSNLYSKHFNLLYANRQVFPSVQIQMVNTKHTEICCIYMKQESDYLEYSRRTKRGFENGTNKCSTIRIPFVKSA